MGFIISSEELSLFAFVFSSVSLWIQSESIFLTTQHPISEGDANFHLQRSYRKLQVLNIAGTGTFIKNNSFDRTNLKPQIPKKSCATMTNVH